MTDAPRSDILGLPVHALRMDETVAFARVLATTRRQATAITLNVDILLHFLREPDGGVFRQACAAADLVTADGMPIVWLSGWLDRPIPERVTGADLFVALCADAAAHGQSVYLFGAAPGVAADAAARMSARFPALRVAGAESPPLGVDTDPALTREAIARINAARPDYLFVALGAPRAERWLHAHRGALDVGLSMGIGGTFDMLTGRVRRAPVVVQRMGLEWLWRLASEPRRLWRRYLVDDVQLVGYLLREWRARRRRGSR